MGLSSFSHIYIYIYMCVCVCVCATFCGRYSNSCLVFAQANVVENIICQTIPHRWEMNRDYRNGYAVDSRTQIVEQLRKSEKEYQSVLTFLEELQRQGCDQRAFLPLGPLAYASGRLKVPKGVTETKLCVARF